MKRTRYGILCMAILFALTLSALNVAPAFADEVTPPVEEIEATSPVEEAPQDVGIADTTAEEASVTVAEVIESLPADTEVVVVNEAGEALPLASEEAAEIAYNGDPLWCPAGVAPNPGMGGCSPSFTSFNNDDSLDAGLIAWLNDPLNAAATSKAGVIWIAHNYAAVGLAGEGGNIVIDGTLVGGGGIGANMENFALTIQGGWNGISGSKALDTTTPYSTIVNPFQITNWVGAITINNILVEGAMGLGVQALNVVTQGNITVNNVDVQNNTTQLSGAELSNVSGTGNVVVNDSTFNDNTGSANSGGLSILSNGTVTLKNVTANGNSLYGVNIANAGAVTPKAVTLNGTNHFSYNGEIGLYIATKGIITLNNVTAMSNLGDGTNVDNCDYDSVNYDCNFGVANGVTIKGTNNFSNNGWDGLRVWSGGAITVSNITANGNGTSVTRPSASASPNNFDATGKGAFLFNYGAATPKNIILSGTNTFNNNASSGIYADSFGMITVNNITANGNDCDLDFEIDTVYCAGAYFYTGGGFTQTGYGRFEGNTQDGLRVRVYNKGAVLLNNLYADNNGDVGVEVTGNTLTGVNVTINGTNIFSNNNGDGGLSVVVNGAVTLSNIIANDNVGGGVYVDNTGMVKPVTIKGINTFNGNGADGLTIFSYGAITTNALTAMNNFGSGVYLDNCEWDTFTACLNTKISPITLNGNNNFISNGSDGLYIESRGAITINNLTANYNGGIGAIVWNQYDNAVGGITFKGFSTYISNFTLSGLNAISTGAITLINVTANFNNTNGIVVDNAYFTAKPANVTITGTNEFILNGADGLRINTYGTVLLSNITANYNGSEGTVIDANDGTILKIVTLNGNNIFNGNSSDGLYIEALGAIKINNVMANDNIGVSSSGAELYNSFAFENQPITITGYGIFNGNGQYGLYVESNGNLIFANLTANNNVSQGANLSTENNLLPTSTANVTLTGINTFNENLSSGLAIFADGMITASNLTANSNGSYGAYLDNDFLANGAVKTITLTGTNMFNNNQGDGLLVYATSNVMLTRITANYNNTFGFGTGLEVYTNGSITLTCGSMNNNAELGYNLNAGVGKVVTLKGVYTYGNGFPNFSGPTTVTTRTCPLP
jgi:hypothetical protein